MLFLYINIGLAIFTLLLLITLSMLWPPESPWSPWWRTDVKKARAVCRLGKIGKNDVVFEPGSGNATVLMTAAKEFGARGVGIELDPPRALISRIFLLVHGVKSRVKVHRTSFFNVDMSDATVVYTYLIPKTLMKLKPKFLKELQPGTRIISLIYPITYLPLIKENKKERLMLYEIPAKSTPKSHKKKEI